MVLKFGAVFIWFGFFHIGFSSLIVPSLKGTSTESINTSIEQFRRIYSAYPCSDKTIVERMFNDFYAIQNLDHPGQLEAEEAEMDLLYLMVVGKRSNISITKWYLIFEKTVDSLDKSNPASEDRKKANEKMLKTYLTLDQIKKLNVFLRFIESSMNFNHLTTMLRYLYGFPIGMALGIPETEITKIIEEHTSMDDFANQLGKTANDLCEINFFPRNDRIAHDLISALLTNRFLAMKNIGKINSTQ